MAKANPEKKLFKDWFDRDAAEMLGRQIKTVYPQFKKAAFINHATKELEKLEFAARVEQFAQSLYKYLPNAPSESLDILKRSLPPAQETCDDVTDGWLQWPIGQFIALFGKDHYDESMQLMIELTKRFTSEFAVRPFVEIYPDRVFKELLKLSSDPNPHVRRWSSEGIRPRLPWGKKLKELIRDPAPIIPVLENLKDDPELYVRKSVANNLNDISKDHPDLVIKFCKKLKKKSTPEREWLIKQALRTLIKDGDPNALELLGFGKLNRIKSEMRLKSNSIKVGEYLQFEINFLNQSSMRQSILIDFAIYYLRQNGSLNKKVFKGTQITLNAGDSLKYEKRFPMKITTVRKLYSGTHKLSIQLNGNELQSHSFELTH